MKPLLLYTFLVLSIIAVGQNDSLSKHHLSLNFGFNAAFSKYYMIQSGHFEEKNNILFYNASIKYDFRLKENVLLDINYTFDPIRVSTGGSHVDLDTILYLNNAAGNSVYYERGFFLQDYVFYNQALDVNFQIFKKGKNATKGISFTAGIGLGLVTVPNKNYPIYPGAMDPTIDLHNDFTPLEHKFEHRNYVYMRINMGLQYLLPVSSKWSMIFAAHATLPVTFNQYMPFGVDLPWRDDAENLSTRDYFGLQIGRAIFRENGLIGKIGIRYALF